MIPAGEHFERALALTTEPYARARLQCQAAASLVATGDQRGLDFLREALAVLDPISNPSIQLMHSRLKRASITWLVVIRKRLSWCSALLNL